MNNMKTMTTRLARVGRTALGGAMLLGLGATSASATTLTFDFGLIGANGGSPCSKNCVLPTLGENYFTTGGITVGAIGYNAKHAQAYVTQKPGAFAANGGETGLGESDKHPKPSSSDYEITTSTYLLIDNSQAFNAGYQSATFSLESLQKGEGGTIYAYTGPLASLDPSKLTFLAQLSAPATGGVTQTVAVPNNSLYLVVQAYKPPGGSSASDIVVAEEVLNTAPVVPTVPEPAAWVLMLTGFGGLGAAVRTRRRIVT